MLYVVEYSLLYNLPLHGLMLLLQMKTDVFCEMVPWRGRRFGGMWEEESCPSTLWKGVDELLGCYGVGRCRKLNKCGV